jgi:cyclopropane fatty-acyl-phospholipid synthase-like methyltransferase
MMKSDILGTGLQEYFDGQKGFDFTTYLELPDIGHPIRDTFSPGYFFRTYDKMPALEQQALALCHGKILDIGCGAGSHSLYLQQQGMDITAIDISAGAIAVCNQRGVKNALCRDVMKYTGTKFDTILLLMNGIGIAGNLRALDFFIDRLLVLLTSKGQIILDSSDIRYMYQEDENNTFEIPETGQYYGEGRFIMEYRGKLGHAFDWLYLDAELLAEVAGKKGLNCEIVSLGPHYDYLARLFIR